MKNSLRKIWVLLFACSTLSLSGCEELFDCIASARPNIHSKRLATGTVGGAYSDFLESDVTNDPHDDRYDYFYSVEGNLPPGLAYREVGRKIIFSGTPTASGSFTFKVRLTVDPDDDYDFDDDGMFDDGNRVCFGDDTTTKEFTIDIQ